MRLSKAALQAEGWRPRAPETPEPESVPEPAPEGPTAAELLAPVLADLAEAMRVKSQPVVVKESNSQLAKAWRVTVNRNPKTDLIESFDIVRRE